VIPTVSESVRKAAPHWDTRLVLVCLVPFLQVLSNREWIFNPPAGIDQWLYFGYFNNPGEYLRAFAGSYYGSRLSWIIPGAVAYRLFNPVLANYVLHLGFCVLALVALYLTLRCTSRPGIAFLVTVITAAYPAFQRAMGWDYVDGAGITYYLIAICLRTLATRSRRPYVLLTLSGAAFAGAVHTNIFWLVFSPLIVAYCMLGAETRTLRSRLASTCWFAAGGAIATATLGAFNAALTGQWLFFEPSFRFATGFSPGRNPYKFAGYAWLSYAHWLVVPAAILLLTVWFLVNVWRGRFAATRQTGFFAVQYVLCVAIFVALEATGFALLETQYYASYLIPVMALAAAVVLDGAAPREVRFDEPFVVPAVIAMTTVTQIPAVAWAIVRIGPASRVAWTVGCVAVAVVAVSIGRRIGTLVFIAVVAVANSAMADPRASGTDAPYKRDVFFRAVAEALPIIRTCGPSADAKLWYDSKEPDGVLFVSVSSAHFWSARLVSEEFPSLKNPATQSTTQLDVGDSILMLSDDKDRWRRADDVLRPLGFSVDRLWSRTLPEAGIPMSMSCLQVAALQGGVEAQSVVALEPFTRRENRSAAAAVHLGPGPALELETNRSSYDWQVASDAIPVYPARDYELEFTAAIDQGGMGVIVIDERSANVATWFWYSPRAATKRHIRFRPEKGSAIRIVVTNCVVVPRVSRFSLKDVRLLLRSPMHDARP